ncbi:hypothetical protein CB0940_03604 [Cercospora beticola]|uniref:Uncharacterized protein n=1 Tax=Cercospora beticola TaxID=122368 RepID=A0A2G5I4S0_CERBT|nr:hypothetical protein CB0940_03604 [Cercospora beticola]PIA99796.1 hypothetical protein CB0940_03604 [Cercospora beticola]WPB00783.1 hypothetical protein RHO25_005403 [Cercospora beticola]
MQFSLFIYSLTALSLGALAVPTQDPKTKDLIKDKNTTCFKDLDAVNAGTGDDTATAAACDSAMAECGAGLDYIGYAYTNSGSLTVQCPFLCSTRRWLTGDHQCSYDPKTCKHAQKHIENICKKEYDMVGYTSHNLITPDPKEGGEESN